MGNSSTKSSSDNERDKGPFSDEEYQSLQHIFLELCQGPTGTGKQIQLSAATTIKREEFKEFFEPRAGSDGDGSSSTCQSSSVEEVASFSDRLYSAFERITIDITSGNGGVTMKKFVSGVAQITKGSQEAGLQFIFNMWDVDGSGALHEEAIAQLFRFCYFCSADESEWSSASISFEPRPFVKSLLDFQEARRRTDSAAGNTPGVSASVFTSWAVNNAPLLHKTVDKKMRQRCFAEIKSAQPCYTFPVLAKSSQMLTETSLFALSIAATELQTGLSRLYTSETDGLSFNRLCHHILGYSGPTLLVIKSSAQEVFGAYAACGWKESTVFFGHPSSFLFRLTEPFGVYLAKPTGVSNYMYLNTKGFALPHGLGLGGDVGAFRFFLDEDFEKCSSRLNCLTYQSGPLSTKGDFDIECMEVWGCGGMDALAAQAEARKEKAKMIDKARKVDRQQFLGEFDQEMFLGKTFGHRGQVDKSRIAEDEKH